MSSGKTTRFQNNVRIDGDLDLSNSTGSLTVSTLSSAPSSPSYGQSYYDSTLGKYRIYQITGWSQVDGSAAGSLDAAYNGGAEIAVDGGAVTLTDTQTTTGGGLLITKSGVIASTHSASVFHINSTGAHSTSGTVKFFEISVGTETIGTPIGMEVAMGANTDSALTITTGAVTLTDGAMTLTSGALTLSSGGFTITSGAFTYTAGDMTMSDGSLAITDADAATTLTVTNNSVATADLISVASTGPTTGAMMKINANATSHDGEVLELISAGDAGSTPKGLSVVMSAVATGGGYGVYIDIPEGTTGAKGIYVQMDKITTSDMLYLDAGGATMTAGTGTYINCNDDDVSKFTVSSDGRVVIAGTASGTDALTITAGDILLTAGALDMTIGDMTLADGSLTITDADAASSLVLVNNSVTTQDLVDISSTSITTTGTMMKINANAATHDGSILELVSAGDTTSVPAGLIVTIASVTTGAARGIEVTMVGSTTTAKGISVTMDALTTGDMLYLDNGGGTLTEGSGFYINCNDDNTALFSVGAYGETDIAGKAAGTAAFTIALGDMVITDSDASTITSVNGTGDLLTLTGGGVTGAGNAMLVVTSTGTIADGAFYVDITSGANGASSTDSYLLHVDAAHTNIEAIHVDAGNVLFDEGLTVTGTLTQTGIATFATGMTQTAVSRTPTADGTGTGVIAAGTSMVDVTGGTNTNCWLTLPTPVVGHVIWLVGPSGTNFEIRANQPATVTINGASDTNGESPVASGELARLVCTSATSWLGTIFTAAGTESDMQAAAD